MQIYRLWRIWNGNWYITVVPSILLICETAFGILAPVCLSLAKFDLLVTAINCFLGFNTALQVVLTVLICFQLLDPRQIKLLPAAHRARRFQIVRCIIESGLVVTIALVIDLALYVQDILFHWVLNICLTQLYAITTVLIVLRMNTLAKSSNSSLGISNSSSQGPSHPDYPRSPRRGMSQGSPLALNFYHSKSSGKSADTQSAMPPYEPPDDDIEMKSYEAEDNNRQSIPGISVHVVREVYPQ